MLQDFDKSVELLKKIRPQTEQADLKLVDNLIASTEKEGKAVQEVMRTAKKKLEEAGFTVIPTPGAFFAVNQEKTRRANFFNALSGYSPKTKQYYYIVGGSSLGKNLGTLLMDAFTLFLKNLRQDINIYFIGRNPVDPNDFFASDKLLNENRLGVHCLSLETKICGLPDD